MALTLRHFLLGIGPVVVILLLLAGSNGYAPGFFSFISGGGGAAPTPIDWRRATCRPLNVTDSPAAFSTPRWDGAPVPARMSLRWRVEHCFLPDNNRVADRQAWEGRIVFSRLDRCNVVANGTSGRRLSPDASSHAMLLERFGPDDLRVELQGPEMLSLEGVHLGACAYAFHYAVTIPGTFNLLAHHLYDNYAAVDETLAGWPPMHADSILGGATFLSLPARGALPSLPRGSSISDLHHGILRADGLAPCAPGQSEAGRWVSTEVPQPAARTYWTAHWPPAATEAGRGIRHVNVTALTWVPYGCAFKHFATVRNARCLSHRNISMIGDSHTRVFFNALLLKYAGVAQGAQKGLMESQCWAKSAALAGSTFCFEANLLGALSVVAAGGVASSGWDIVYSNFGQHHASSAHRTIEQYTQALRAHFAASLSALAPHQTYLWSSSQDIMPASDPWPGTYRRDAKDWRTQPRLRLFSEISVRELQRARALWPDARVVYADSFNASLIFATVSPDGAHIYNPTYQKLLEDRLTSALCP